LRESCEKQQFISFGGGVLMGRCIALRKDLERCSNDAERGSIFCRRHRWWWAITLFGGLVAVTTIGANIAEMFGVNFPVPFSQAHTPTPSITLTPRAATQFPVPTITPTFVLTPTNTMFSDGFESGDLTAWADPETYDGDLTLSTAAAFTGNYGLQAIIDDTTEMFLYHQLPIGSEHFVARFNFDPNSIDIPDRQGFFIFGGERLIDENTDDYYWVFCLYLQKIDGEYRLSLCGEDSKLTESKSVGIQDGWNLLTIEWHSSSSVSADDGYMKLWINDDPIPRSTAEALTFDPILISNFEFVIRGNLKNVYGTIYFDEFELLP
jgi:hypothetical protein